MPLLNFLTRALHPGPWCETYGTLLPQIPLLASWSDPVKLWSPCTRSKTQILTAYSMQQTASTLSLFFTNISAQRQASQEAATRCTKKCRHWPTSMLAVYRKFRLAKQSGQAELNITYLTKQRTISTCYFIHHTVMLCCPVSFHRSTFSADIK